MSDRVTIRIAHPEDAPAIIRLAQLDCARVPPGRLLVAEVDGELWAAVSLQAPAGIADPFRRSAELLLLLHERARQLERAGRARTPSRSRWRALVAVARRVG